MRWFMMAPLVQRDLRHGIPGLSDVIAKIMMLNEDPEVHVLRLMHENERASWWLMIESPSWLEEVEVEPNEHDAFAAV